MSSILRLQKRMKIRSWQPRRSEEHSRNEDDEEWMHWLYSNFKQQAGMGFPTCQSTKYFIIVKMKEWWPKPSPHAYAWLNRSFLLRVVPVRPWFSQWDLVFFPVKRCCCSSETKGMIYSASSLCYSLHILKVCEESISQILTDGLLDVLPKPSLRAYAGLD